MGQFFLICLLDYLFHHHLLKSLSFLNWIAFATFQKSIGPVCMDLFVDSLFCTTDLWPFFFFFNQCYTILIMLLYTILKSGHVSPPTLVVFQNYFGYFNFFVFPYKF
jgi:hypothetical protein